MSSHIDDEPCEHDLSLLSRATSIIYSDASLPPRVFSGLYDHETLTLCLRTFRSWMDCYNHLPKHWPILLLPKESLFALSNTIVLILGKLSDLLWCKNKRTKLYIHLLPFFFHLSLNQWPGSFNYYARIFQLFVL